MENETITLGEQKKNPNITPNIGSRTPEEAEKKLMQQQSNGTLFPVATETIDLPSKGVFYAGNKSSVKIKYLTAAEDDILFSPELIKKGKQLDALLEAVIIDKDLRPEQMLSGDRNYILISARRTGFGDEYKPGETICPECSLTYEPIVDLSKLKINFLEHMPDAEGWYPFQMPTTKLNIRFRFLTGSDEDRLRKIEEKSLKKVVGNFKSSKLVTERYILQIMEVNGNKDKGYINAFIQAMPTLDSLAFRNYVKSIQPDIDLNYEFECPHCGHSETKEVPITTKLFYPES